MTDYTHIKEDSAACEPGEFENTTPVNQQPDDNIVGERFGKYVLVGEIAVGGPVVA